MSRLGNTEHDSESGEPAKPAAPSGHVPEDRQAYADIGYVHDVKPYHSVGTPPQLWSNGSGS